MPTIKKIFIKTSTLIGMFLLLGAVGAQAATLTVTTTADAGSGSLRQAFIDANTNAEANVVDFDVPMTDAGYNAAMNEFTINLLSPLPDVPAIPLTVSNNQPQAMVVKGNNTFRIFTLVDSAVFTVNNLTVTGGYSNGLGGGILMGNSSTLHLNRSTISNNAANEGGGIYVNQSGTLNINASTVSGNTATSGGGIYNNFTATLNNSLVALNTAIVGVDLFGRDNIGNRDGYGIGAPFTGTYNLIGNADDSDGLTAVTNRLGSSANPIDPLLGALENNGGATLTRALLDGSPAIDKGNSPSIISDQRGEARPYDNPLIPNDSGDGADIGAYEVQAATTVSVGGRILKPFVKNAGVTDATVFITDSQGVSQSARTDAFGFYNFAEVVTGKTYVFTVRHKGYIFAAQIVEVTENLTELNFVAEVRQNSPRR